MFIPKITVKKIDYEYNVSFISELLIPRDKIKNTSLPFSERVYGLIPELKSKIKQGMTRDEIYHEVDIVLQERLYLKADEIDNRVVYIQKEFDKIYLPLMRNLLKIFELEWDESECEIICYLGCCPVFKIAPYPQMAYQQFYEQTIKGISIMDNVAQIYRERKSMEDFLDKTYEFICNNIEEIIQKCG